MMPRIAIVVVALLLATAACRSTAAPRDPDPLRALIFVPGFAGSELIAAEGGDATVTLRDGSPRTIHVSQGEVVWPHFSGTDPWTPLFDSDYYRVLRIGPSDPLAIQANGKLYTGDAGYGEVERFFSSHSYVANTSFFPFGWDWRRSVVDAARRLDSQITDALRLYPGDGKVDIVAHSAGSLVVRAFLLGTYANRLKVAHVVMLGAPGLGVPASVDALLVGACLKTILFICIFPADTQRYVFQTSPGAAQGATSSAYYANFRQQDAEHPVAYTTVGPGESVPSYQVPYDWFSQNVLTPAMAATAIQPPNFHDSDLTWLGDALAGTTFKIALGAGSGKCALGQLRNGPIVDRSTIDGDTMVPRQSALFGEDLAYGYLTNAADARSSGRVSVFVRSLEHGELGGAAGLPDVLAWIRSESVDPQQVRQHICPATAP